MSLNTIKNALLGVSDAVYHFSAPPNTPPPYIEWAEDGENAFMAGTGTRKPPYRAQLTCTQKMIPTRCGLPYRKR